MSIQYDMYPVKDVADESNDGLYRAHAVSRGKITTEKLIKHIAEVNGFTNGIAKGVLISLEDAIINYLSDGYDVQLGEIGYFSVSVTSRLVKDKRDLRAESVSFKKLNFRLNNVTRRKLQYVRKEKVDFSKTRSSAIPLEKKVEILQKYLNENMCITRKDYSALTKTLKDKAIGELNRFIEEGWLRKYGTARTTVYLLNK